MTQDVTARQTDLKKYIIFMQNITAKQQKQLKQPKKQLTEKQQRTTELQIITLENKYINNNKQ